MFPAGMALVLEVHCQGADVMVVVAQGTGEVVVGALGKEGKEDVVALVRDAR